MGICEAKASLGLGTLLPPSTPSPPPPPTAPRSATDGWELGADDSGWNIEPSGWEEDDDEPTKDSPAPPENRKDAPPPVHYPQRPGEPDWVFYVKSGSCEFGMNCKFNHPAKESPAPLENRKDAPLPRPPPPVHYPQRPGEPDCVFYVKSGSCKFGMNCKFNHPAKESARVRRRKAQGLAQDAEGKKKNPSEMMEKSEGKDAKAKKKNPSEKMEKTEDKVMKGKQNQSLSERKDPKDNKDAKGKKKNPSEKMEKTEDKVMKGKQNQSLSERKDQKDNKDAKGKKKNPSEKMEKTEDKQVMKGKQNQSLSERKDQKDNKHYPVAGDYNATEGCKDGNFQGKAELARVELNFLGLPIRPGEIECPHYMDTGGCKFSTSCRYHHPDPTAVVGQDPVLGFQSGGPQQHMSGASAPPMTSWPSPINSSEPVPYFNVGPSYTPGFYPLPPQGLYPNPQWNGYQVPAPVLPWMHPDMNATNFQGSTSTVTGGGINQSLEVDEYPDRPGQPECDYFTRTGTCKFKSE